MLKKLIASWKPILFFLLVITICITATTIRVRAAGAIYYVSTSGNDNNTGTSESEAFSTFSKAVSVLNPGDEIQILAGTYNERLKINKNGNPVSRIKVQAKAGNKVIIDGNSNSSSLIEVTGNYVTVADIEVRESDGTCVNLTGQHIEAINLEVHECEGHGVYGDNDGLLVEGNTIYRTNLENSAKNWSSGWGSALKLRVGSKNAILRGNTIYHNYGEGIAATRSIDTIIEDNYLYDNYSVNIYIDNSYDVLVQRNFSTCKGNQEFHKGSARPAGIAIAEEQYSGWGAQLRNVKIINNISSFCQFGITYYGADVSGGGLDNVLIAHNTIWGAKQTGISIEEETAKTNNTVIANNIIHFDSGGKQAVIPNNNAGISLHHNFWVGGPPESWMNASGTGDLSGDVKLASSPNTVDSTTYRLSPDSPAIGEASNVTPYPVITTDYENRARGGVSDIGAFEYGAPPAPTPTPPPSPSSFPSPSPSSPGPSPLICENPLDINGDNSVGLADYTILVSQFMETGENSADLNCDGTVNLSDYTVLIGNFQI